MTTTAVEAVAAALARIADDERSGVWITVVDADVAMAAARDADDRRAHGADLPLVGTTLAVKDNIDVAGLPTTAGCPAFTYQPPADAQVVAALTAGGTIVIGKTNLDQFATGLGGVRSPYGIPPNAQRGGLIPGGSSSGSAVAVATGMVDLALGTDTAGSGRVPAACNGIVGVKPTRGRVSTRGIVPACRSLDCVSVFATDATVAALAVALAAGHDPGDPWSRSAPLRAVPERPLRIGVPAQLGDVPEGIEALRACGAVLVDVDIVPFLVAGDLLYGGAFVAERYEAVGAFVDAHRDEVHPVVGEIIAAAGRIPAWQVFRDRTELTRVASLTAPVWDRIDVLAVPSVPRVPTVEEALAEPIAVNAMLGTYTNFVNLLDLCALTLPVDRPSSSVPPPSITLIAPAWCDDVLVSLAAALTDRPASLRTT